VPRGAFHRLDRMGLACLRPSVLNASRRFLGYRRSYWLLRHSCEVPANVGWRWIGRAVASRLLMRVGGGVLLSTPPATTSGHPALDVRGCGPNFVCRSGGCSKERLSACRPRICSRSWVEMSKNPQGTQALYRHFRPLATVNVGNFAKYFAGAYCTHRAAFWHLPTIRLLQRLGLALGRLRGLGLLPGLGLPLLLSLECPRRGCGSCVGLLLLLQQGRVRNRTDSPPANVALRWRQG
jgi:hypothetical protein